MEEKLASHKNHYHLFYGGYRGISVKNYADMFVRKNRLRETPADNLTFVRAVVGYIVIKKIDEKLGRIASDWTMDGLISELFGEESGGVLCLTIGDAPIYITSYVTSTTTKESACEAIMASRCHVASADEVGALLDAFRTSIHIESCIVFDVDDTRLDGVDVDNVICKFAEFSQICWADKLTPSHYAVLVAGVAHAISAVDHELTAEKFHSICEDLNITSPVAWCFECGRVNSYYDPTFESSKTFANWFCSFVTRFILKLYSEK